MDMKLSEERSALILGELKAFFLEAFDEELSDYRAERLLEFFLTSLGPPVYNQAVQDARAFMLDKLEDLAVECYQTEKDV